MARRVPVHDDRPRRLGVLVVLCAVGALWLLTYPFDFGPAQEGQTWLGQWRVAKLNTLSNVLLFLPWGLCAAWWGYSRGGGRAMVIVLATLGAGLVSLTGETAQLWLPTRESSAVDLLANLLGGVLGAIAGYSYARAMSDRWEKLTAWLATRPMARRAGMVLLLLMVARLAPFDVSIETYYLRTSLTFETRQAGYPFSATIAWRRAAAQGQGADESPLRHAAQVELARAGCSLLLFAVTAVALARAVRESFSRRGEHGPPILIVLVLGAALVVVSELLQWPVRSRLMDATDPVAGLAGVVVGVVLDLALGRPGKR